MNKVLKCVEYIFWTLVLIILSPIIILCTIAAAISSFKPRKAFKFLKKEGFAFGKEREPYAIKWTRDSICIRLQDDRYQVSFDCGNANPTFTDFYESGIGTPEEREQLREVICLFKDAHPRDRMEGFPDIHTPHVKFIERYINEITTTASAEHCCE